LTDPPSKQGPLVLIVDDDPEVATMLSRALSRHGYRIDTTSSPEQALSRAAQQPYQAAVLDLVMPERDGAALATALREKIPGLPIALLTGYAHSPLLRSGLRSGMALFSKPVAIQELVDFLKTELH
jgi:CheY-like chemotaxis protein